MDRDLVFAIVVAVFGTALAGSFFFSDPPTTETKTQVYAPDDIRYRLQQEEFREQEKAKKRKVLRTAPAATAPVSSSADNPEDVIGQPSLSDHPRVGEPPLE